MKKIICLCLVFVMSLGMMACAKETQTSKYLTECEYIREWSSAEITTSKTDSFGIVRENCIVVDDTDEISSNAMYAIDDSYATLTGTIVCSENAKPGETGRVDIYVDYVRVYSTPIISVDTEAVEFSIEIPDAKMLIIDVVETGTTEGGSISIILSDFKLNK